MIPAKHEECEATDSSSDLKSGYWGIHDRDVPKGVPGNLGVFWNFITGLCYNPTLAMVKVSALLFLLRLGSVKRRIRIACHVLIAFNLAMMVAFFTAYLLQCLPIESRWMAGAKAKCVRTDVLSYTLASLNILTDILTLSIPFFLFLGLRVNKRTRNALLIVFMLGAV